MPDPDPIMHADSKPPNTASWEPGRPLDVPAVAPTVSYPLDATASFAPNADAPTVDAATDETYSAVSPDLPEITGYRVLRVIDSGGMGTVFKAVHVATKRLVALKLINAGWEANSETRTRFTREAETLAALKHPNVVPIYDAGTWQGLPYLTMEYVEGKTLYHHLDRYRTDLPAGCRVLSQVARAVHYLHSKGIIHRDLKPLNILLTRDGVPLVADFGLVRLLDNRTELTVTQAPIGTRFYMAPEQTLGGPTGYTPSCDVWALGIMLYELLSGSRPFQDGDVAELYRQIRHDPAPALPAGAPPGLAAVCLKCLAKQPADRYATAAEVAEQLERWLAGDPVDGLAPPVESVPPAKARRWARVVMGSGVAIGLALSVAALAGAFHSRNSTNPVIPPAARSTAERIGAGETVLLIGPDGLPPGPTRNLPGCSATFGVREGFASLTAAGWCGVELCGEELPLPVVVRAEYAVCVGGFDVSEAGVYVAGLETPANPKPYQSVVSIGHRTTPVMGAAVPTYREIFGFSGLVWLDEPPGSRKRLPARTREIPAPPLNDPTLHWRFVEVVIRADEVTGGFVGLPVPPAFGALRPGVSPMQCLAPAFTQFRLAPPRYIGPGIGVFVLNAEAVFRNVTIQPLK